ncbi:MAG: HpcH/HpaI aldolase family protein [Candidatus Binataceae bacterium]
MAALLKNSVHDRWQAGIPTINGWLALPTSLSAEIMARAGFDTLTIDMQHGAMDYRSLLEILSALTATEMTPVVRVPNADPTFITRVLDIGALGVICPMISSAEQAREFAAGARYHPVGNRSSGPLRAAMVYGSDYFKRANDAVLVLGMIETPGAIASLDEILQVETMDGIYVGPNDLGIALGMSAGMDREEPEFLRVLEDIARRANARGKIPGIHTNSSKYATRAIGMGYGFITVCSDAGLIGAGAATTVRDVRAALRNR